LLKKELTDQRILFYGAGSAATGISHLIVDYLKQCGIANEDARKNVFLYDSKGSVTMDRKDLSDIKKPFAQPYPFESDFQSLIEKFAPTAIIGVSGVSGAFDQRVIEALATKNERPIIFALSNPTSKSECTARQAYEWTNGKAIFASGSPFSPVTINNKKFIPGQGNNAYVFPGFGFGAVISKPTHISNEMFIIAAKALAGLVTDHDLKKGRLYPSVKNIRSISTIIAQKVAHYNFESGISKITKPLDLESEITQAAFIPDYPEYV